MPDNIAGQAGSYKPELYELSGVIDGERQAVHLGAKTQALPIGSGLIESAHEHVLPCAAPVVSGNISGNPSPEFPEARIAPTMKFGVKIKIVNNQ